MNSVGYVRQKHNLKHKDQFKKCSTNSTSSENHTFARKYQLKQNATVSIGFETSRNLI